MKDVILIKQALHVDHRGHFFESFNQQVLDKINSPCPFVQNNISFSEKKNTIRGLHYQSAPYQQAKYICLLSGSILDVFVDARPTSDSFGSVFTVELTEPGDGLYLPRGYCHGFRSLEDNTRISYMVDNPYQQESELSVRWDDSELNIDWKLDQATPITSEKDLNGITWNEFITRLKDND